MHQEMLKVNFILANNIITLFKLVLALFCIFVNFHKLVSHQPHHSNCWNFVVIIQNFILISLIYCQESKIMYFYCIVIIHSSCILSQMQVICKKLRPPAKTSRSSHHHQSCLIVGESYESFCEKLIQAGNMKEGRYAVVDCNYAKDKASKLVFIMC